MILDPDSAALTGPGGRRTLDDLFRTALAHHPDALALADPIDRAGFAAGTPRRLTYAEADRAIGAMAGQLQRSGLSTDAVVAFQLPNTVDAVIALLGILRAGMIAAPLPLLWRRAECVRALSRVGAKALITCVGTRERDLVALAMQVAADVFPIHSVFAFGAPLPEGVVSLDDIYGADLPFAPVTAGRVQDPAAHVAVITWDTTTDGLIPVARNHAETATGGLAVSLPAQLAQGGAILSTIPISSFAGLSVSLVPWLLTGGRLVLHQPFEPDLLRSQLAEQGCGTLVIPGTLATRFSEAGVLALPGLRRVIALWRAPERLHAAPAIANPGVSVTDVAAFGETGLVAGLRDDEGRPVPIPLGIVFAPRGAANSIHVVEVGRSGAGTLTLRGPMVPRAALRTTGRATEKPGEPVDTGYPCRIEGGQVVVTGPPAGIASVGAYRFNMHELRELVAGIDPGAALTALPDGLTGQKLAGAARNRTELRERLAALGANSLVVRAFRDRAAPAAGGK